PKCVKVTLLEQRVLERIGRVVQRSSGATRGVDGAEVANPQPDRANVRAQNLVTLVEVRHPAISLVVRAVVVKLSGCTELTERFRLLVAEQPMIKHVPVDFLDC